MNWIVSNWRQVWKSLAVWLPILATGLYAIVEHFNEAGNIPVEYLPVVVAVLGALGWVKKQRSITR